MSERMNPGQIWKVKNDADHYYFMNGTYFIVLSINREVVKVGNFWQIDDTFGGARLRDYTEEILKGISDYVTDLQSLLETERIKNG